MDSGHSDVSGNEIADSTSRKAANTAKTEPEPIALCAALSAIRRTFRDYESSDHRAMRTYKGYKFKSEAKTIKCKKDVILLELQRSGHFKLLKTYANLMEPIVNPTCPLCTHEPHTLEHWLDCPDTSKDYQKNLWHQGTATETAHLGTR